ncbi:protein-export chaperone SecB [Psychroflexus sp. CAK57W]|uniref:protein-export chaperone SecB n=1 Tax=Psychroflexus curvus TaxID=2873595 RepID=UPI001CC8F7A9|nr:protein-export chaperone SecB [Psychroflexus curvus]MBZ9786418.1 protein-export chaperone SecB [Psychroflexus curvus]
MAIDNKAAFYLKDFEISKFNFSKIAHSERENVSIGFDPEGSYSLKDKIFYLTLKFRLFNNDSKEDYFNAIITGFFAFQNVNSLEEVPTYFYKNSIAILYPYLRAFVSSVTLQANIKSVILPTMNLSSLEPELLNSTKEIE